MPASGGRADDYMATGVDFHTRGRILDAELELLHAAWRGELVVEGDRQHGSLATAAAASGEQAEQQT